MVENHVLDCQRYFLRMCWMSLGIKGAIDYAYLFPTDIQLRSDGFPDNSLKTFVSIRDIVGCRIACQLKAYS